MRFIVVTLALSVLLAPTRSPANDYDYFSANRQLVWNGVQALITCNGLFTSHRTLQQIFKQELAYMQDQLIGTATGGNYRIDKKNRWVEVGGGSDGVAVGAAYREGIGCVAMSPGMTAADIDSLPQLRMHKPKGNPAKTDWPNGDRVKHKPLPAQISAEKLRAASDWAFNRPTAEQDTISLIIVHQGDIIHERYAPGFDITTRTRTYSTAKSIAATLIGMQVDAGHLDLDKSLGIQWLPEMPGAENDPRHAITLRHVLNMASGLEPVDSFNNEYATGSGLAYYVGLSSIDGMRNRGLVRTPGSHWEYENYDTLLATYALKRSLKNDRAYLEFPRRALFDPIGMRNTIASTDRFGNFIFSSQVYTNARDLARFGLLYAQQGLWNGKRLLSRQWIDFISTPAPATAAKGNLYGGQWWLVTDERKSELPPDAYGTAGNRGQYVVVAPSQDLVIVRRGLDYGKQGFDPWDLLQEVLKAFTPEPPGQ